MSSCGICGHRDCYAGGFFHPTKLFSSREHPHILGKDCIFEYDLPKMSKEEYDKWYEQSEIVFGVRMGPMYPSIAINSPPQPTSDAFNDAHREHFTCKIF